MTGTCKGLAAVVNLCKCLCRSLALACVSLHGWSTIPVELVWQGSAYVMLNKSSFIVQDSYRSGPVGP